MEKISLPDFKNIKITDRETFESFFEKFPPNISEYTFTNLYMWRNHYNFNWKIYKDQLILLSVLDDKNIVVFPPTGNKPLDSLNYIIDLCADMNLEFEFQRFPKDLTQKIMNDLKSIQFSEDRNNWDYVYNTQDLMGLPGKEFANIRKKLNKFKRSVNWSYEILNKENIVDCLDLQEEWCNLRHCEDDPSLYDEDIAIKDILENWSKLDFTGGVLRSDDKIIAYSLGGPLDNETMVCHVEKANPDIFGAYQAINQQFAEFLAAPKYKYINREQDLGEESLRYSKTNYKPVFFNEKYFGKLEKLNS